MKEALREVLYEDDVIDTLSAGIFNRIADKLAALVEVAVRDMCSGYETRIEALDARLTALEEVNQRVNKLVAERTDELEQYQRRTSLRIFGIEEKMGEDTDKIVSAFMSSKLGIEIQPNDLCRTHRVGRPPRQTTRGEGGSPPPRRHRAILVKFATYNVRGRVFAAKRELKNSGFVITEDLTSTRRKVYLDAVTKFGKNNVWTIDGVVKWKGGDGKICRATTTEDLLQ